MDVVTAIKVAKAYLDIIDNIPPAGDATFTWRIDLGRPIVTYEGKKYEVLQGPLGNEPEGAIYVREYSELPFDVDKDENVVTIWRQDVV